MKKFIFAILALFAIQIISASPTFEVKEKLKIEVSNQIESSFDVVSSYELNDLNIEKVSVKEKLKIESNILNLKFSAYELRKEAVQEICGFRIENYNRYLFKNRSDYLTNFNKHQNKRQDFKRISYFKDLS